MSIAQQEDCVFYNVKANNVCSALKHLDCIERDCPFHKSKSEYIMDVEGYVWNREEFTIDEDGFIISKKTGHNVYDTFGEGRCV